MSKVESLYQQFLNSLRAYSSHRNVPFANALTSTIQDEHALFAAALLGNESEKYLIEHYRPKFIEWVAETLLDADQTAIEALADKKAKERAAIAGRKGGYAKAAKLDKPKELLQQAWASGNFATRDICAEENYGEFGFNSLKTARSALQGTPDPDPWPAKKKRMR